jgi:hypothetical protein
MARKPEGLGGGPDADGANLTYPSFRGKLGYLSNQPVAQLLCSLGRHRVSISARDGRGWGAGAKELAGLQHRGAGGWAR